MKRGIKILLGLIVVLIISILVFILIYSTVTNKQCEKFMGEVNYKELTKEGVPLSKKDPLSITVCKIGDTLIIDPTYEEEKIVDARLTVAITNDGNICSMQKGGEGPLSSEDIGGFYTFNYVYQSEEGNLTFE